MLARQRRRDGVGARRRRLIDTVRGVFRGARAPSPGAGDPGSARRHAVGGDDVDQHRQRPLPAGDYPAAIATTAAAAISPQGAQYRRRARAQARAPITRRATTPPRPSVRRRAAEGKAQAIATGGNGDAEPGRRALPPRQSRRGANELRRAAVSATKDMANVGRVWQSLALARRRRQTRDRRREFRAAPRSGAIGDGGCRERAGRPGVR